ncbi:MAG: bifunctional nuclease family protein [Anaerolineaceae bacterium]
MGKMRECVINSVRVSLINQDRIVVLKDKEDELYLPIWIGLFEFESITIALQKIETARPLTHDLMKNLISSLDARLIAVEITTLESDTYYANLIIEQNGVQKRIDCRPSDAIALVVRTGVPIFVDEDVLERAGIRPEPETSEELDEGSESAELPGDLSVFEDFFDQLNKQKPEKSEDEDEDINPTEDQGDSEDLSPQ